MGEQALRREMVTSSYMCQPNHSYEGFMFCLHSGLTHVRVVVGVLHSVWSELPPPREYPGVLFIDLMRLWPQSFHKIMLFAIV